MAFTVVCISHTDGSGGEGVARAVSDALAFRYVNEEIILEAARMAQVDPETVAAAEQKQSLLQRIFESLAAAQEVLGAGALGAGYVVPISPEGQLRYTTKEEMRLLIRAAIVELSRGGRAVIGTHAASMALAGRPGVLRVLVTAPAATRASRIAAARGLSAEDAAEAVEKGDRGRRDYLRKFYEIDEELPTHYDLVVNTEVLGPAEVVALVVAAAGH